MTTRKKDWSTPNGGTMNGEREGPEVATVVYTCKGCRWEESRCYADFYWQIFCHHPRTTKDSGKRIDNAERRAPDWCPYLQPTVEEVK